MTSEDTTTLQADLAFLRALVENKDWRPGLWGFGALYFSLGATLVAHVLVTWGAHAGYLPLQGAGLVTFYVVLYATFSLVWAWVAGRFRRARQPGGPHGVGVKGRAGAAALGSAFLGHLVMLGVLVIVAVRQRNGIFLELTPLVLFTLQGVVWFVVHALYRERWHLVEGWGWLVAALVLAPLVGTDAFNLGIAAAAVALMIVPGAHMMRVARNAA